MQNKSLLRELFFFAGKYKYLTICGMFLSAISAILMLFPIIFMWLCVQEIFVMYPSIHMTDTLKLYICMAFLFAILALLVYAVALLCTHKAAFRISKNMRSATIRHIMNLPLGFFKKTGSGKLYRIIDDSASTTESYLAHQLPDIVGAIITPVAVLVLIFIFDWRFGLSSLISLLLATLALRFMIGKGFEERTANYQNTLDNMNNKAVEFIRGIPVIKAFGQDIYSFKKFYGFIKDFKTIVIQYTKFYRTPMCLYQTFLASTPIFICFCAIFLFSGVSTSQELLLNFLFYVFFTPVYGLMMGKIMMLSQESTLAADALHRVQSILQEKPIMQSNNKQIPSDFTLSLHNVSFKYPDSQNNAIDDICLEIKEGQHIALVGESGSGKTTLVNLLARFWDIDTGSVKLGGIDIKDVDEEFLLQNMSFVFQNPHIYMSSVLENVREGKPHATEDEVKNALSLARCDSIIQKLPHGIHTVIGKDSAFLSGGEAQRISIARAILKDAPIILLDEATSFADPENEYEILHALASLSKGKTVIMIAHRLSAVKTFDCIYYMENGRIAESGSHDALIIQNGKYAIMWQEYQKAFVWGKGEK